MRGETNTTRTRTVAAVVTAVVLMGLGCTPDDPVEEPTDPDTDEQTQDGTEEPSDTDPEEPSDDGSDEDDQGESNQDDQGEAPDDGADDGSEGDGLEVLLAVDPGCAEIGDDFTVMAEGLEPDTDHIVAFDPAPSSTGEFESGVPATSDGDGTFEVDGSLPEDAGIENGDYRLELFTAQDGETDTSLIATDLEIADRCSP